MKYLSECDITINVGSRTALFPNEIVCLEAEANYTTIHLSNGKKMMVSYHLGKLQERLLPYKTFVRANRKFIVNLDFLGDFNSQYMIVKGQEISYSRRRKDMVISVIEAIDKQSFSLN